MKRPTTIICALLVCIINAWAQDPTPTINPTATYTNSKGEQEVSDNYSGSAPIEGLFEANPENVGAWSEYYEWRFKLEKDDTTPNGEPYLIRYERDTECKFTKSGTHKIVCYAIFTQGNDTVAYTQEYWGKEKDPLAITISESKLTMPNAFSPNGDTHNDIYQARDYESLVEFRAIIFNRWGQKIYEWTDPSGGWDGKWNGNDVKEGVYYVDVTAKGADGRHYHIRRDVNLMRNARETESSSSSTQ